ncbi:MAG: OmpA family protein [Ferruginibacter sp.]
MKTLLIATGILCSYALQAQFGNLLERAKQKTVNKVDQKIDQKMDKAIGNAVDSVDKGATPGKKSKSTVNQNSSTNTGVNNNTNDGNVSSSGATGSLKSYSKFDFVPGEKILVAEDFIQDAIGDFPARWNTNASGEVVTVNGQTGHWLMVNKKGRYVPEYITSLPENFTLQFDVICNEKFSFYSNFLQFYFITGGQGKGIMDYSSFETGQRSGVKLGIHPCTAGSNGGTALIESYEDGNKVMNNETATSQFNSNNGKTFVKVSVWRQKQRIRMYLNEEKVLDLPRAFPAGKNYNTLFFEIWSGMHNDADRYLISNLRLAAGAPDTRNKLITEGKFVTHGILFDVNSDKIKPESYGALKDIAAVLSENAAVRVKIIGHTDADGDDKNNMELSKKRAEAVKASLIKEFAIEGSRMETDGKGKTMPIDKNTTAEGKANNRRVEFIKL